MDVTRTSGARYRKPDPGRSFWMGAAECFLHQGVSDEDPIPSLIRFRGRCRNHGKQKEPGPATCPAPGKNCWTFPVLCLALRHPRTRFNFTLVSEMFQFDKPTAVLSRANHTSIFCTLSRIRPLRPSGECGFWCKLHEVGEGAKTEFYLVVTP
ncbi:hypothetical protein CB1_000746006 [Camelus ferus]|nr:hypothetical protein CB1_000746006 [Camelus ferus]